MIPTSQLAMLYPHNPESQMREPWIENITRSTRSLFFHSCFHHSPWPAEVALLHLPVSKIRADARGLVRPGGVKMSGSFVLCLKSWSSLTRVPFLSRVKNMKGHWAPFPCGYGYGYGLLGVPSCHFWVWWKSTLYILLKQTPHTDTLLALRVLLPLIFARKERNRWFLNSSFFHWLRERKWRREWRGDWRRLRPTRDAPTTPSPSRDSSAKAKGTAEGNLVAMSFLK